MALRPGVVAEEEVVVVVVSHQEVRLQISSNCVLLWEKLTPWGIIGGRGGFQQMGPPDHVIGMHSARLAALGASANPNSALEMGSFLHGVEGDIFCQSINPKVPYFNAPIFLENKVRTAIFSWEYSFTDENNHIDTRWQGRRDYGPIK